MKCSNCGKELTKDITGNNGLKRTYQCECLRLELFYEIEGPEWLLKLADNICYRLDIEQADKFKDRFKALIKNINEDNLKRGLIELFRYRSKCVLKDLCCGKYASVLNELDYYGYVHNDFHDMSNLGHSLINYSHMMQFDEPDRVLSDAWGVEYDSYGNKKSYEQSAIKYADIVLEVMEANCDKTQAY